MLGYFMLIAPFKLEKIDIHIFDHIDYPNDIITEGAQLLHLFNSH